MCSYYFRDSNEDGECMMRDLGRAILGITLKGHDRVPLWVAAGSLTFGKKSEINPALVTILAGWVGAVWCPWSCRFGDRCYPWGKVST